MRGNTPVTARTNNSHTSLFSFVKLTNSFGNVSFASVNEKTYVLGDGINVVTMRSSHNTDRYEEWSSLLLWCELLTFTFVHCVLGFYGISQDSERLGIN